MSQGQSLKAKVSRSRPQPSRSRTEPWGPRS